MRNEEIKERTMRKLCQLSTGLITLIATLSLTGCPEPDIGITTGPIAELGIWLAAQTDNDNPGDDPYIYMLKVDDLCGSSDTYGSLGYVLRANGSKYVILDLSGSNLRNCKIITCE
jgi:hypothetical protein